MKNPLALLAAAALAATVVLTGCGADPEPTDPQSQTVTVDDATAAFLEDHGLAGLDTRQIIDRLDTTPLQERATDLMASIRPNELLMSDAAGRELALPMPEDVTYVSFAPYLQQTHDCYFHSLTTCTGELQNTAIDVTVTDNETGDVIVQEQATTFSNGFLGLWLPRGLDGTLTVAVDGLSATVPLTTTGAEDATCLTTLQLS